MQVLGETLTSSIKSSDMKRVYFDNAATTPIDKRVIETMAAAMRENFGNPSSIHAEGRIARAAIEEARKTVAACSHDPGLLSAY